MIPGNDLFEVVKLVAHCDGLPDPRGNRTQGYELINILVISLCTLLGGGAGFNN